MRLLFLCVLVLGCGKPAAPPARAERYASLRASIDAARKELAGRREEARRFLVAKLVDELLPAWNGTPWDFYGTSQEPGRGEIACGYFVSTTLSHAGLRVERVKLAQQASERIIKSLVAAEHIARFSDVPLPKFVAAVAARGAGLYVVGLDNHVGYLIVDAGGKVWFHHSSYLSGGVIRQQALASPELERSRYRVIGKLFADDTLVDRWLGGAPVPTI
jgi:hypothetical protein